MVVATKATRRASETLPLEEQIRQRAYELFVERGKQSGSELKDWLQAESEILAAPKQKRERQRSVG